MGNSEASASDLRVVELWKTSAENTLAQMIKRQPLHSDDTNRYVCLGHFDSICVKAMDASAPLSAIENDSKERDNYCHPLYIVRDISQTNECLDLFWASQSCFMTISRVHFSLSVNGNLETLMAALEDLADDKKRIRNYLGDMGIYVNGEAVYIAFYRTLELGDIVMALKSNAITSCLEVIRRIMEVSTVGDVYSFCGIHYALVESQDVKSAAAAWDIRNCGGSLYFTSTAMRAIQKTIPHVSMRFSIASIQCAKFFWETMEFLPSFISGTADALQLLNEQRVETLIRCIHHLVFGTYTVDGAEIHMYDAFEDIITRIGTGYGQAYVGSLKAKPRVLPGNLPKIREACQSAVIDIEEKCKDARWLSVLKAQTNTLITMMGNCVTDDLSMLITPSVQALLERLKYIIHYNGVISRRQETEIGAFLNSWDILENDISRLEGQLSQNPELMSSRYYIPATLLAFYMALLSRYNSLLLTIDESGEQGYVPLVTYNSAPRRACTTCILDPAFDNPVEDGSNPYEGLTPLLVSLPVTMMYKPMETAVVLCHEMSHYTGTSNRFRKTRFEYILTGCAGKIAKAWKLDGHEMFGLEPDEIMRVLGDIAQRLETGYTNEYCGASNPSGGYYIDQLRHNLPKVITDVYYDLKFHSSLVQRYAPRGRVESGAIAYARSFDICEQHETLGKITGSLQNMLLLYRECYADLMAILTLQLTKDEYLLYMFYPEEQYLQEIGLDNSTIQRRMAELCFQAAAVLYVLQTDCTDESSTPRINKEQKKWISETTEIIKKYHTNFVAEKDIPISENAILLQSEYLSLINYLKYCEENISKKLTSAEEVKNQAKNFRGILADMKERIDLCKIQEIVAQYREKMLGSQQG